MATVALTDLDDESRLPEGFWQMSTCVALGAAALAPRFGERPQDALCLGLLAPLGIALLHHSDRGGYAEVAGRPTCLERRGPPGGRHRPHPPAAAPGGAGEGGVPTRTVPAPER